MFAVNDHKRMGSIPIGADLMVELVVFFLVGRDFLVFVESRLSSKKKCSLVYLGECECHR